MNTYCVVLRPQSSIHPIHPRIKRCCLKAEAADRAILSASEGDPDWRVIGIEPSGMFAPLPSSSRSDPSPEDTLHVA